VPGARTTSAAAEIGTQAPNSRCQSASLIAIATTRLANSVVWTNITSLISQGSILGLKAGIW